MQPTNYATNQLRFREYLTHRNRPTGGGHEEKIITFNDNGFIRRLIPLVLHRCTTETRSWLVIVSAELQIMWRLHKAHAYKYPTAAPWRVIHRMTAEGDLATVTQACLSLRRGNDPHPVTGTGSNSHSELPARTIWSKGKQLTWQGSLWVRGALKVH